MSIFSSSSFTVAANTPLESYVGEVGATWTLHPAYSSRLRVLASDDRLIPNATGTGSTGFFASGIPASNEYDVEGDVIYLGTANDEVSIGITARMDTTLATFYMARHDRNSNTWQLYRAVNNAFTLLGSYSQTLAVGTAYRLKLEVRDGTKKLLVDGVERISSTDSAITAAGRAGVRWFLGAPGAYNARFDNFVASDIVLPGGSYAHIATGGAQSGGSADISVAVAHIGVGGGVSGGSSAQSISINHISSGGLQSSGAADLAITKSVVGEGGATTGGSAALSNTRAIIGVGGAISGGAADVLFTGVNNYDYIASGGLQSSGVADLAVTKSVVGEGGATAGGSAALSNAMAVVAAGGAISGGAADISFSGVTSYSHIASGGLLAAGAAQVSMVTVVQGAGGGQSSGAADVSITKATAGSGGALSGGAAIISYTVHIVGAGGAVSGGEADVTTNAITNYSHIAAGGAVFGGEALLDFATTDFPIITNISFTLKGRTTCFTLKSRKTIITLH